MTKDEILHSIRKTHLAEKLFLVCRNRETGVHRGQFRLLQYIVQNGGCTQVDAAEYLMVTPASVALSCKRMVNAGLIERKSDDKDRRRNTLFATPRGMDACHEAERGYEDMRDKMFEGFTDDELNTLGRFHERMIANLSGNNGDVSVKELIDQLKYMEEQSK